MLTLHPDFTLCCDYTYSHVHIHHLNSSAEHIDFCSDKCHKCSENVRCLAVISSSDLPLAASLEIRGIAPPLVPTLEIRGIAPPLVPTLEDQRNGSTFSSHPWDQRNGSTFSSHPWDQRNGSTFSPHPWGSENGSVHVVHLYQETCRSCNLQ